ncbi:hypothetical protein QOZ80_5AG0382280 [Eleusine coracana subsp. coracana]|nr:hypothetical protein QOZ80_5AG0382280 [Eleusine coracana subsp. coracana]
MADCFAPEADDLLHRRWLPREIFADIGIADPEPLAADAAPPAAATAVAVEKLAAQLAGMLGAGAATGDKAKPDKTQKRAPQTVAPAPAAVAPFPPVCGLEGTVAMAYGGCNVVAGGAAVAWPVAPYSPLQWQVAPVDYSMLPPVAPPHLIPPPGAGKLRGGTGVFLPRAAPFYRHAPPTPAKDGKAPFQRTWVGTGRPVQQQYQKEEEAAAGKSQQRQNGALQLQQQEEEKATAAEVHACSEEALALPQDWSYH